MLDVACAAIGFIVTFGTDEVQGGWILSLGFIVHLAWLCAGAVAIRDDALFVRSWRGWSEPVLLDQLVAVGVEWKFLAIDLRRVFPLRSVWITDAAGAEIAVTLVRWRKSRHLLETMLAHVRRGGGAAADWTVDVDRETKERLERLIGGW